MGGWVLGWMGVWVPRGRRGGGVWGSERGLCIAGFLEVGVGCLHELPCEKKILKIVNWWVLQGRWGWAAGDGRSFIYTGVPDLITYWF